MALTERPAPPVPASGGANIFDGRTRPKEGFRNLGWGLCPRVCHWDDDVYATIAAALERIVPNDDELGGAYEMCLASAVEMRQMNVPVDDWPTFAAALDEFAQDKFTRDFTDLSDSDKDDIMITLGLVQKDGTPVSPPTNAPLWPVPTGGPAFTALIAKFGAGAPVVLFSQLKFSAVFAIQNNWPHSQYRNEDGSPNLRGTPDRALSSSVRTPLSSYDVFGYPGRALERDHEVEKLFWKAFAKLDVTGYNGMPTFAEDSPGVPTIVNDADALAALNKLRTLRAAGVV